MTETSNREATATDQFQTPFHYLTAWFRTLGPFRTENESPDALDEIPPFDDRQDLIRGLEHTTEVFPRKLDVNKGQGHRRPRRHPNSSLRQVGLRSVLSSGQETTASPLHSTMKSRGRSQKVTP